MIDLFKKDETNQIIERIIQLNPNSQPLWGKMNVAQMLAHCNVTYNLAYANKTANLNPVMAFLIKTFIKPIVVGPKPYKKNSKTVKVFLIADERDFELEKQKLIDYLIETQKLGRAHFEGKLSHSFGPLTGDEWNTMFYKHLNHHLQQFGV